MAASNKPSSCSPMASSRTAPSARNSETKDPMRRSFTGSPFSRPSSIVANSRAGFIPNTPANSPSDYPRRSSIGRESFGSLRDLEDKENGKDATLKAAKARSPASASKGTKNFMSPTISAASKFTSSPRKKVLVERNEPVRSSVSFSEIKSQVIEDNVPNPEINSSKKKTVSFSDVQSLIMSDDNDFSRLETGMNQDKKIEASPDTPITDFDEETLKRDPVCESEGLLDSKKNDVSSSSEAATTEEKECFNQVKISPRTSCSTSETGMNQDKKIEASPDTPITDFDEETLKRDPVCESEGLLDSKKNDVSSSAEAATTEEKDCVNLDPTFKISPRTSCSTSSSVLAPLDADPFVPPYDPKTNYLSPRPQFLHYRPNPRIEHIRNKGRDGKRLEESFASENLSDSEVSGSLSEDVSSDETVIEGEEVEEEEELNVSEPNPVNTFMPKEKSLQPGVYKTKFFTRTKFVSFLLVLAFAGLSIKVIDSPGTDLSMLKEFDLSNLYVHPEISEFARVKLEGLARRSQLWAANSVSYIYKLISDLRGVPKLPRPFQFSNLTDLFEENHLVDGYQKYGQGDQGAEFKYEHNVLALPIGGKEINTEPLEETDPEFEADENVEEVLEETNSESFEEQAAHEEINKVLEDQTDPEPDEVCLTPPAEVVKPSEVAEKTQEKVQSDDHNDVKLRSNIDLTVILEVTEIQPQAEAREPQVESYMNSYAETESTIAEAEETPVEEIAEVVKPSEVAEKTQEKVQSDDHNDVKLRSNIDLTVISEVTEIQPQAEAREPQVESYMNSYAETESTIAEAEEPPVEEIPRSSELDVLEEHPETSAIADHPIVKLSEDNFLTTNVVGISLLVLLSLLAATALYAKKGSLSTPNTAIPVDQPAATKKLNYSPISLTSEHTRNCQAEDDVIGESCPSEMSSFRSSSYSKRERKASSEAQSQEKKPRKNFRRESLASSEFSMSSHSYGSFTTYEKIPSKHGLGDEEVVTPVRRSSRLRNHTSP